MSNENDVAQDAAIGREEADLHSRYGKIGISAVVAALQYSARTRGAGTMHGYSRGDHADRN